MTRAPCGVNLRSGDKWTLIVDDTDFTFYKAEAEKEHGVKPHDGWPDEYPCLVRTEFYSNDNGPDELWHRFMYVQDVHKLWKLVEPQMPRAVANEMMED